MASVNKVILVGNLGRDPEIRSFSNGDRVANVNLATTDRWKDKQSGEMREATEWHRIVFNGRLVDIVEQYLRKGSQVYVEGSLRTRKWQDKDGQEKYTTEIRVDQMQMLGGRQGAGAGGSDEGGDDWSARRGQPVQRAGAQAAAGASGAGGGAGGRPPAKSGSGFDDLHDDIPF